MINAMGISTRSVVFELAPTFKGNRSERLKEAWRVVKAIIAHCCKPEDMLLIDDMGICPNCCKEDYLLVDDPYVTCMNCGEKWLVIDDGYNGLLNISPNPLIGSSELS